MCKKLLVSILLLVLCGFGAFAQQINVSSFDADMTDMDARVHAIKYDHNGKKAALIKIETSEKGFAFDNGSLGIVDVEPNKVGEVWVYVPQGTIRLKISHQQLGILKYEIPIAIKEATVYTMKLTTSKVTTVVEQSAGGQYLVMNITPLDAELAIDGGVPQTISGGVKNIFLPYGRHAYTVSSRLYISESGEVNIGTERSELKIDLIPNFGYLDITTNPTGATVEINDMAVGKTPYKSDKLPLGKYTVRLSIPNYAPTTQEVSLTEGAKRVSVNKNLSTYLSVITIKCPMASANILINNEKRGVGSWSGTLLPGTYEIKATYDGYRDQILALEVEQNTPQSINIAAPTPIYGILNINTEQSGVMVSIDGKELGEAPNVFSTILVGKRKLTLTKDGFVTNESEVVIEEEKITNTVASLEKAVIEKNVVVSERKDVDPKAVPVDSKVYQFVEQMPQFPGGDAGLMNYLRNNISYPEIAAKNNVQGRVIVQFVVTANGGIGDVKVARGVDPELDKEAVRVVKSFPKFTPGRLKGSAVNVWYTLPVNFKL